MIDEDRKLMELLEELSVTYKEYENKFGKGSLDYWLGGHDPVYPDVRSISKEIFKIRKAIKNNKKLPEVEIVKNFFCIQ
ncbi:hypothetical protein LRS64_09395 (plasmid) [Ligilactobacillus salivarius]|uniref:hypothetical protein n=1 Tax=Ligilactobacillus salivarius TaxID=1624 RepID=UPI003C2D1954